MHSSKPHDLIIFCKLRDPMLLEKIVTILVCGPLPPTGSKKRVGCDSGLLRQLVITNTMQDMFSRDINRDQGFAIFFND